MQEATVLSRAVKEHERRGGQKEGFSVAPGDCLAFKYYRDVSPFMLPPHVHEQCLSSWRSLVPLMQTSKCWMGRLCFQTVCA